MFGKKDDDGDLVKMGDNPGQNMGLVLMEELWDKYMRTHMWPLPKCDMEKDKLYGPASDMKGVNTAWTNLATQGRPGVPSTMPGTA